MHRSTHERRYPLGESERRGRRVRRADARRLRSAHSTATGTFDDQPTTTVQDYSDWGATLDFPALPAG